MVILNAPASKAKSTPQQQQQQQQKHIMSRNFYQAAYSAPNSDLLRQGMLSRNPPSQKVQAPSPPLARMYNDQLHNISSNHDQPSIYKTIHEAINDVVPSAIHKALESLTRQLEQVKLGTNYSGGLNVMSAMMPQQSPDMHIDLLQQQMMAAMPSIQNQLQMPIEQQYAYIQQMAAQQFPQMAAQQFPQMSQQIMAQQQQQQAQLEQYQQQMMQQMMSQGYGVGVAQQFYQQVGMAPNLTGQYGYGANNAQKNENFYQQQQQQQQQAMMNNSNFYAGNMMF